MAMTALYDLTATSIDGTPRSLAEFQGSVLLVVNVASRCGFTPQYRGLEAMYRSRVELGFSILGFPCDQFGHQEPGTEEEIQAFCSSEYDVTFPLFAKIEVNGPDAHPVFEYLKNQAPGLFGTRSIKWNFTKFLVDRDGRVVRRFGPRDKPSDIEGHVDALLE